MVRLLWNCGCALVLSRTLRHARYVVRFAAQWVVVYYSLREDSVPFVAFLHFNGPTSTNIAGVFLHIFQLCAATSITS